MSSTIIVFINSILLFSGRRAMKQGWGERLKLCRAGHSQLEWCEIFKLSRTAWINYENEDTSPNLVLLTQIAAYSGKSIHWIATGEEPPMAPLDEQLLLTATTSAMKIVESQAKNNLSYTPLQVASFIVDIYGAMAKEVLDGTKALSQPDPLVDSTRGKYARNREKSA
jgi:DNA-binding XRE family transcriptional regulator